MRTQPSDQNCPKCGTQMVEKLENNGFTMPEGPEMWEVESVGCPSCGYTEE